MSRRALSYALGAPWVSGLDTPAHPHDHGRMDASSIRLAIAILLGVVVVLEVMRRRSARQIAERWLTHHNYRVRWLRPVYLSMRPHFRKRAPISTPRSSTFSPFTIVACCSAQRR